MKSFDFNLINPLIEKYIEDLSIIEDEIILEMQTYADDSDVPIVGPLVGRFLYQLALISDAKKIFELGSGFGYSAFWFARALGSGGKIICTDYSKDHKLKAEGFFKKSGIDNKMQFITGNSLDILNEVKDSFDIIFNDVDKDFYPSVIDLVYEKLNPRGLLITDNVLWHGRVIEEDKLPSTKGVKDYNKSISSDDRFFTTLVPLRDGLSISYKVN